MRQIPLTQGKFATVDDEDYEKLNCFKWFFSCGYARRDTKKAGKRYRVYMHREILKTPPGFFVDHIDGDRIMNTRNNLRAATNRDNVRSQVSKRAGKTSIYKGVSRDRERGAWQAAICVDYKKRYLGRFPDQIKAANAYNQAALEHFGSFAKLNVLAQ